MILCGMRGDKMKAYKYVIRGRNLRGDITLDYPIDNCFDCPFCNTTLSDSKEPQEIKGVRYCNLKQKVIDDEPLSFELKIKQKRPIWCALWSEYFNRR